MRPPAPSTPGTGRPPSIVDADERRGSRPNLPTARPPTAAPPGRSTRPPPSTAPLSASMRAAQRPSAALRLSSIDYDLVNAARRVVEGALAVVPGERVLLILDRARRDVGAALLDVARGQGVEALVHELEDEGERPLRAVSPALDASFARAQASVYLASWDEREGTFRQEILSRVKRYGLRHADMRGVTRRAVIAGFSVDHARILDAARAVRTRLRPTSQLKLRTPRGSDLEVRLDPSARWAERVGVLRPGRWESLPPGRLTAAPLLVRGVFVADASVGARFGAQAGVLEQAPVRFEIEGGLCRKVSSIDRALERDVEAFLAREHGLGRVGLVSLGVNVGLFEPTGEVVADQTLPGLHLTFGALEAAPGLTGFSTRGELPVAVAEADVDLDGQPLLRSGRYIFS